MGRRPHVRMVTDPFFDEFIYDIIYAVTPAQRRELDKDLADVCSTPNRAKKFAQTAGLEQKYFLLAALGIKRATILFNEEITPRNFKDVLEQFRSKNPAAGLKEMAAQKLYITSDRELMFQLISMGQTIHHPQYPLSVEWNKLGYKLNEWGAWTKTAENATLIKANENIDAIHKCSLLLEQYNKMLEGIETLFNIRQIDFRILNFMLRNRHRFVPKSEIVKYFTGAYGKVMINTSLVSMIKGQKIQVSAMNKKEYTITALGINLLDKVFQRILSSNNF